MRSETMHKAAAVMLAAAALAAGAPAAAAGRPERTDPATLKATGEPVRCVQSRNVSSQPAGQNAIMFRASASRWFRNDLRGGCPMLRNDSVLVFRNSIGGQFCSLDMFEVVDPMTRTSFGTCSLGEFTPVKVPKGTRF